MQEAKQVASLAPIANLAMNPRQFAVSVENAIVYHATSDRTICLVASTQEYEWLRADRATIDAIHGRSTPSTLP